MLSGLSRPGRTPPLLSPALREALRQALADPPPDGGLWTSRKVAAWMAERLDREVGEVRGWEALRSLVFTPQRPRPHNTAADPESQAAFKRGLAQAGKAVRTAQPDASVTVWAEDEHRLGLLPVSRRVWALVDEPVANRAFADLDELDAVLEPRCRVLAADRATIQSSAHFHWWPEPRIGIAHYSSFQVG